jgi:hypothetical protein
MCRTHNRVRFHKRVRFPTHVRLRHLPTNASDFHHKRVWFGWRENVQHIDDIIYQQNIQQLKIWMRLFRTLAFSLGPFNGKKPASKDTNPETFWNNFDKIIYNLNPNPNPILTLTLALTLTYTIRFSLNNILFTHLYLWLYSIEYVITLNHGQNCKYA